MPSFTLETLQHIQAEMQDGTITKERVRVTDDETPGLSVIVSKHAVNFFASYEIGETSPILLLGNTMDLSIDDARLMTTYVRKLAGQGIDVKEEADERMRRQLREDARLKG